MARLKTIYVCGQCGYSASGWLGKCPSCDSWGSFSEEESGASGQKQAAAGRRKASGAKAYRLSEIESAAAEARAKTGVPEFDRVLGGGIVHGSLVLVGGDPGIGKSTLLLQMCSAAQFKVLYVSGEESAAQINIRAKRLGVTGDSPLVAAETRLSAVEQLVENYAPGVVIIDSIQTMYDESLPGTPGSVGQIRGVTMALMRIAKASPVSFVIVGHVTKDGAIAGPKVLEHMVDTVLYFEGERSAGLRILRAVKNRFGSTNEIGVFDMSESGLVEVENPSAMILSERPRGVPGSVVVPSMEGTRSMLVEIQALATRTNAQNPRRMATGVDYNRMTLMIAVLEKRLGLKLYDCDIYANAAGGLKLYEPACDLGIVAAIASSFKDKAFDPDLAMVGEVGLTGEIRGVDQLEKRLNEAARLGFTHCVAPESSLALRGRTFKGEAKNLNVIPAKHIVKIFDLFI